MPRSLSATLTAVKSTNRAHTHLLLDVTAGAQPFFFADQTLRFEGIDYVPRLTFSDTINHTRSLQLDRAVVAFENASLFVSDLLHSKARRQRCGGSTPRRMRRSRSSMGESPPAGSSAARRKWS